MSEHTIESLFTDLLKAEEEERLYQVEFDQYKNTYTPLINGAQHRQQQALQAIEAVMKETGEYEALIPSADPLHDYKLSFRKGVDTVKADVDAVPEKYVKIERSVKKKELLADLKLLRDAGQPLPNYATIERGADKLQHQLIKKTTTK